MMPAENGHLPLDMDYVESCRKACGLSNKAIAKVHDLSESSVSRFFSGHEASMYTTYCILDAIGASMDRAFRIVKPITEAVTDPMPSLPAIITDAVQALPPLVDTQAVADKVAQAVAESPLVPDPIDPIKLARDIAAELRKTDRDNCDSCRCSRLYEATIARQSKLISVLIAGLGSMVAFLIILAVYLLLK